MSRLKSMVATGTLQYGHDFSIMDTPPTPSAQAPFIRHFNMAMIFQSWIPGGMYVLMVKYHILQYGHDFSIMDTLGSQA